MNKTTVDYVGAVKKAFTSQGWLFNTKQIGNETIFGIAFPADHIPHIFWHVRVFSNGDVKFWTYLTKKAAEEKRIALIEVLNKLNDQYRYLRAYLDDDQDICASYDITLFGDEEACMESILRHMLLVHKVADEYLPNILKVIWSTNKLSQEKHTIIAVDNQTDDTDDLGLEDGDALFDDVEDDLFGDLFSDDEDAFDDETEEDHFELDALLAKLEAAVNDEEDE